MKKLSSLVIGASAILFASKMNAQTAAPMNPKTLVNSVSTSADADKVAMENIRMSSERMYRDFSKYYKNASAISIEERPDITSISCSVNGKKDHIVYSKKGNWQNTVCTYDNEQLPPSIREAVENEFPHYSIYGPVLEVITKVGTAHLVLIENKTSWKRVKVVNGEVEIYEEWNKQ